MLELKIIEGLLPDNPTVKSKIFNAHGGVIGRDRVCAWVLFDREKVVSSEHAKIIFAQGAYYLSDISTNGVFNALGQPLGKGELRKLVCGDVYMIGPYRIEVSDIKLGDPEDPLRDLGLQHLLLDHDQPSMATPLDYSGKKSIPTLDFDLPMQSMASSNRLNAYDFMPEPLELVPKPQQQVYPVEVPVAASQDDFITALCEAFNLDLRLLSGQSNHALQHKVIGLIQGVVSLLLDLRALDKTLQQSFALDDMTMGGLHNPLTVAVSSRQLFELIMRDDSDFLNAADAMTQLRHTLLARMQKLLANIPLVQQKLLLSLAPDAVFVRKSSSKLNVLQYKHAWQAYQHHYQTLSVDQSREWLKLFQSFMKEKLEE
jgi:type VI secretion system protein ImpI